MSETKTEKNKERTKKGYNLVLSKWFYYVLIAILLCILISLSCYAVSLGNEMAARFLPTLVGLAFTFFIFIVFFDVREELEWKTIGDRVKKRIGTHLQTVFVNLVMLCEVESVLMNEQSEQDWKRLNKKQLDDLVNKGVKLTDTWKGVIDGLPSYLKTLESRLGEIEGRYGKFLGSKIQTSLMDVEEYLHGLSFELEFMPGEENEREKRISDLVLRTMKEIAQLRESGVDIGF